MTELLMFGVTGFGSGEGFSVPETRLVAVDAVIEVVNSGILEIAGTTDGQKGIVRRADTASGPGLVYEPNANVVGPDSDTFTYLLSDGRGAIQTVQVNVTIMPAQPMIWDAIQVEWPSVAEAYYGVQRRLDLGLSAWQEFKDNLPGNGITNSVFDSIRNGAAGFYRVSGTTGSATIHRAVEIGWRSEAGSRYRVQWSTDPASNSWQDLYSQIVGNGTTNTVFDATPSGDRRYYRVMPAD